MRTAAPCSITARRSSSALSTRPAANSTASSVNPSAEPSSYPQIPRTRHWNQQPVWRRRAGLFKLPLPLLRPISANREEKRNTPESGRVSSPFARRGLFSAGFLIRPGNICRGDIQLGAEFFGRGAIRHHVLPCPAERQVKREPNHEQNQLSHAQIQRRLSGDQHEQQHQQGRNKP